MIRHASPEQKEVVKDMWRTCFGDSEDYMNIYFSHKYRDERTLIYFEENTPVASVQLLPYMFTFYGKVITTSYISGACTLPSYRGKGIMSRLMRESFEDMRKNDIPLSILIPQDNEVINFYNKLGYTTCFVEGIKTRNIKEILDLAKNDLNRAYDIFDSQYRDNDMTVQKDREDFKAIVEEAKLFEYPDKQSQKGMARIIDVSKMLSIFASIERGVSLSIEVIDNIISSNNGIFHIKDGECIRDYTVETPQIQVTVDELASILLGYKIDNKEDIIKSTFKAKQPQIHYMLE